MEAPVSDSSQRRATENDRRRLAERGMARFEVLGRDADRELIRSLGLGSDPYVQVGSAIACMASRTSSIRPSRIKSAGRAPPKYLCLEYSQARAVFGSEWNSDTRSTTYSRSTRRLSFLGLG